MNKTKLKTIVAAALVIIGAIRLVPTIFVQTVIFRTTNYTVLDDSDPKTSTFRVEYAYPFGEGERTASYTETLPKEVYPTVGEQGVCHYYTFPPHPVFLGDAKSPVPPLVCIALGLLLFVLKMPKLLKKRRKRPAKSPQND